jgi:hypothetical protein
MKKKINKNRQKEQNAPETLLANTDGSKSTVASRFETLPLFPICY